MAHGRPWYKRSGGDFVMATIGMPDADHKWAYSACIDMMNDRDRPLTDDPGFICGFTGLSKRKWNTVRQYLIDAGYLVLIGDGTLSNPRFERERAERETERENAKRTGAIGGKKSAAKRAAEQGNLELSPEKVPQESEINGSKRKDKSQLIDTAHNENNDLGQGPPQPTRAREEARGERREDIDTPTPAILRREDAVDVAGSDQDLTPAAPPEPEHDLLGLTQRFARIGGVSLLQPTRLAADVQIVKGWLTAGYDPDTLIEPVIRDALANSRHDSIGSLNFYSQRLARKAADPAFTPSGPSQFDNEDTRKAYLAKLKNGP